jgi:hypothetical protein
VLSILLNLVLISAPLGDAGVVRDRPAGLTGLKDVVLLIEPTYTSVTKYVANTSIRDKVELTLRRRGISLREPKANPEDELGAGPILVVYVTTLLDSANIFAYISMVLVEPVKNLRTGQTQMASVWQAYQAVKLDQRGDVRGTFDQSLDKVVGQFNADWSRANP